MTENAHKTEKAVPPSLVRLDDARIAQAGEGELGRFPPPPDIEELKRAISMDAIAATKMRAFGWISS